MKREKEDGTQVSVSIFQLRLCIDTGVQGEHYRLTVESTIVKIGNWDCHHIRLAEPTRLGCSTGHNTQGPVLIVFRRELVQRHLVEDGHQGRVVLSNLKSTHITAQVATNNMRPPVPDRPHSLSMGVKDGKALD